MCFLFVSIAQIISTSAIAFLFSPPYTALRSRISFGLTYVTISSALVFYLNAKHRSESSMTQVSSAAAVPLIGSTLAILVGDIYSHSLTSISDSFVRCTFIAYGVSGAPVSAIINALLAWIDCTVRKRA
jgi:hypothetical protein